MRLRRLTARNFGPLQDRELRINSAIALLYGSNESGKSSFLEALRTLLYGFDPAKREAHPLAQWPGGRQADLEIEGDFDLHSEGELTVERVLQERGKLRLARDGAGIDGKRDGNRPLAHVRDFPRELFTTIYALTSSSLKPLDQETRQRVDELLLGDATTARVRPTYAVRDELQAEMRRLWVDTRRGKPRARELRNAIAEAQRKLQTARAEEDRLRQDRLDRDRLEDEIDELRYRKRALELIEKEAAFLAEVFELMEKTCSTPSLNLSELGDKSLRDPRELRQRIDDLEAQLAEPLARLERAETPLTVNELLVLDHDEAIDGIERERGLQSADLENLSEIKQRLATLERGVALDLTRFLGRDAGEDDARGMEQFPLEALRMAHAEWTQEWEAAQAAPALEESKIAAVWLLPMSGFGMLFVALAAFGVFPPIVAFPAAAVLVFAIVVALKRPPIDMQTGFRAPERNADVDRFLGHLGLDVGQGATPSAVLRVIEQVEKITSGLAESADLAIRRDALQSRVEEREDRWSQLATELGLNAAGTGAEVAGRLQAALRKARERERTILDDDHQRKTAQTLVAAHAPELEALREDVELIERVLRANVPGVDDPGVAYEIVEERKREQVVLQRFEDRLRQNPLWDKLHDDVRATPGADEEPLWHPDAIERRQAELAEIESELSVRNRRLGEIDQMLKADQGHRIAKAQEEWSALEEELHEVERERDRKALLDRLLVEAERVHREEHQPDVLRRASRYLKAITEGAYTRLDYADDDGHSMWVQRANSNEPVRVGAPLSRGTRDQIYLCLRLGLLDHLDEGRTALPLILDEALVHWDGKRRKQLYPVLQEVSLRRQVIILTCHPHLAAETERALRIRRIDLSQPSIPAPKAPVPSDASLFE